MENSNNTGKILAVFTAVVFLFFIYEVMMNSSKVSQVNVPQKQPSEIVININEKNNNNNNKNVPTPAPVPAPPAPVPAPPAPVPPAPPAPVPAPVPVVAPVPVPVTPATICNCRPIRGVCGRCVPDPQTDSETVCSDLETKSVCTSGGCRWNSNDCVNCITYSDESNCNSAGEKCFWGCSTR